MADISSAKTGTAIDSDVRAVRSLIAQNGPVHQRGLAQGNRSIENWQPDKISEGGSLANRLLTGVRNYEPQQRVILRTSLLVLLVLRPVMVIGFVTLAGLVLLLSYLFAGPYRFWRGVIGFYGGLKRYQPAIARSLMLRAYVIAKRWDEKLLWLPQRIADMLRSPDLGEMIRADKLHREAVDERLSRLV